MKKTILATTVFIISTTVSLAIPVRVNQIPNGNKFQCQACHVSSSNTDRNLFGKDVEQNLINGDVNWSALYDLDSDNDGFTNGQELLDPDGNWVIGDPNPGDQALVTSPANQNDFPSSVEDVIEGFEIKISEGWLSIVSDGRVDLDVSLLISDVAGRIVQENETGFGMHSLQIDLNTLSSGNYYLLLRVGNKTYTRAFSK